MQRSNDSSTFDHATMEQLMARYRAELLSYQRATPPGRPTLAQNLREVTDARAPSPEPAKPRPVPTPAPAPAPVPAPVPAPLPEPAPEPLMSEPSMSQPLVLSEHAVAIIPDPVPLMMSEPAPMPKTGSIPAPAMIAGFAASVAADFTAGIFAAASAIQEPRIVAEAVAQEPAQEHKSSMTKVEEPCPPGQIAPEHTIAKPTPVAPAPPPEVRAIRSKCVACGDAEEQIANAPTRYRNLLPDETAELPTCPCETLPSPGEEPVPLPTPALPSPPSLPEEPCANLPAAPGEGPVPLPTPALPSPPSLPEEPCANLPATPGEGPVPLPTPALPSPPPVPEEPCVNLPAAPGEGSVPLPTPALPSPPPVPEEPCVNLPAAPGEGSVPLPTPALPSPSPVPEEPCVNLPATPGEGPVPLPTPALPDGSCAALPILQDRRSKKPASSCLCCGHTEYEKGIGAYGTFRPYESLDDLTRAAFLQKSGEAVEVLARFAADLPDGGADACRCRRSFSVKFFCRKGEYDLLGQHLPVTVGCEQQAVMACCSTTRADPSTGLRSRSRFWEYVAANPVALHAAVWLFSDLGTIGSYRSIDSFCSPSLWVNARGQKRLARCCWLSRQRPRTLTRFEAEELCGYDPDAVARDFVTAISRGEYPQYELAVQLLGSEQDLPFDPYDPTLIWPQEIAPLRRIGLMTLNRLPEQIHPDLDAGRFDAAHLIEGIQAAPPALPAEGRELAQAGNHLRELSERERRRLIDNLSDELMQLPADLLEQVLILFSKADLGFGQALTAALGG